jgi:hypothetical protein
MHRKSNQTVLLGFVCVSVMLVSCATKRPISATQTSFRLQSFEAGSVLFAPAVPESQAMNAPITLTLNSSSNAPPAPAACSAERPPFRLERSSDSQAAVQIVLPTPERWFNGLDRGWQGDAGDIMESFYSFLADLERTQMLGCFPSSSSAIRDYVLQSIPMRPSESLFNAYGYRRERGGLDLKAGLRVKIERAYFGPAGPGEEQHTVKNYLGVSTSNFDVEAGSGEKIRFQQVGPIQYSLESLEKDGQEGSRDLGLGKLPEQAHYRLLFYTYLVPKEQDISATIIGASNATQLDELERELRAYPAEGCARAAGAKGEECFGFQGFVTVSAQIKVELNGKVQFVDWGTNLKSVLPKNALKSLRIQRQFMGFYYDVRFNPANSNVLSLSLVGGDRLTWSKGSAFFHSTP